MNLKTRKLLNSELFNKNIINWYRENKRDLPWRDTRNPFRIWLSEIILQQTRVAQGMDYYIKFTERFRDIYELAEADEQEILNLWQGLGYYSRARNLHFTAKHIASELNGQFPKTYKELLKLKGVGHYTAAAIASFAYQEKVSVLDGNVYRVLSRVFGVDDPINSSVGEKKFRELSQMLIPERESDSYNQGIMEFGALQCVPVNPSCETCVFSNTCLAYGEGSVNVLPVKIKKTKVKELYLHFFAHVNEGRVSLVKRQGKGIWQNLWEFPNLGYESKIEINQVLLDLIKENKNSQFVLEKTSKEVKHLLSHRKIWATFHKVNIKGETPVNWGEGISLGKLHEYPIHRLMDRFLEENPEFIKE